MSSEDTEAFRAAKLDQKAERKIARRKAFLAKWSKLDWSKQNCELACEMNLTPERIRQIRQQVGNPEPDHPGRPRRARDDMQWAKNNLEKIKGMSGAEVERKYGLRHNWRAGPQYQILKPFLRDGRLHTKHPWHLMNFRLLNRDLERIWKLSYNMVGAYRYRKRLPLQLWRFTSRTGNIQDGGRGQLQAYRRDVKAEERKAARYFAQI
jgi:hypothetical protein